jgi:hypothetical protein
MAYTNRAGTTRTVQYRELAVERGSAAAFAPFRSTSPGTKKAFACHRCQHTTHFLHMQQARGGINEMMHYSECVVCGLTDVKERVGEPSMTREAAQAVPTQRRQCQHNERTGPCTSTSFVVYLKQNPVTEDSRIKGVICSICKRKQTAPHL